MKRRLGNGTPRSMVGGALAVRVARGYRSRVRTLLVLLLLAGCGKGASTPSPGSNSQTSSGTSEAPLASLLTLQSVTLLEPEGVIEQRISDVDALSTLLKGVAEAVGGFDVAHTGTLPAQVDVVVVVRATGTRVWLVGPAGDVAAPGLDADIAKLAPIPVKERHVAAILHLLREGATPNQERLQLPAAWSAAAGAEGSDIDTVIDRVWSR